MPESKDNPKKRAGVCLACTYKCHDGHDLIELYTKRNFRCDCGTSKILAVRCKLDSNKIDDSDQNKYNHNFSGTYCVCKRPYPDPDDDVDDEMIQCVICEDWYHLRHLEGKVPDTNDFDEMICQLCTKQHPFLDNYSHFSILPKDDENSIVSDVNVTLNESIDVEKPSESINGMPNETANGTAEVSANGKPNAPVDSDENMESTNGAPNTSIASVNNVESKKGDGIESKNEDNEVQTQDILDDELNRCIRDIIEINKSNQNPDSGPSTSANSAPSNEGPPSKKRKLCDDETVASTSSSNVCRKPKTILHKLNGASFWTNDWRKALCQCAECTEMYKSGDIEFITDMEDTVLHYTEQGKAKERISSEDMLMNTISNMDHVGKIEAITCYNKLKSKLTDFLASFVTTDKVITETDVKNFFQSNDDKKN